jgi:hypothetical protein
VAKPCSKGDTDWVGAQITRLTLGGSDGVPLRVPRAGAQANGTLQVAWHLGTSGAPLGLVRRQVPTPAASLERPIAILPRPLAALANSAR